MNDTTFAGLDDGAVLTGGHDLTLHASGAHAMTTQAQTGASGGGVTVVPSISIAISNVTSKATIGTGALLTLTGKLDAKAELTASATTTASGSAVGATAAIGVALALTLATHTVESTTHRDVTAAGSVSFQALGGSASEADASASAAGAPGQGEAGSPGPGGVDSQVSGERSHADTVAGPGHDSGGAGSTPSASTSSGGVSVAAAVGISIANSSSRAYVPGGVHVTAGRLADAEVVGEQRLEGEGGRLGVDDWLGDQRRRGRRDQPGECHERGGRRERRGRGRARVRGGCVGDERRR